MASLQPSGYDTVVILGMGCFSLSGATFGMGKKELWLRCQTPTNHFFFSRRLLHIQHTHKKIHRLMVGSQKQPQREAATDENV